MNNIKIYSRVVTVYSLDPPKNTWDTAKLVGEAMLTDSELQRLDAAEKDFKEQQEKLSKRVLAGKGINY